MGIFFLVLFLLFGGGAVSLALGRSPVAGTVAAAATGTASLLGVVFALNLLLQGVTLSASLPVSLPLGHCLFVIDPLAAFFLLPVFLISGLSCLILPARMRAMEAFTQHGRHGFFFCMLIAGMVLVLTAADSVFFLISWEVMSLAPFFLMAAEDKNSKERFSGWIYLVAAHLGALPLLLLFAWLGVQAGGTTFFKLASFSGWQHAGLLFGLALAGFGVKMALFPLHVWIPEAYPVAPGHVASVLSGAMVTTGLYGFLRVLSLLGPPELWWSYTLMAAGGVTGFMGVLFAMAQPDMKRTLAYSSAENMGIICLALGAAMLAAQSGAPVAVVLFLGGGLLHVWNHSLFKSLYFLGASAVSQSTGTTSINMLGGLQKRMPLVGPCMAVASASIAGAPPFNGFVGEVLLFLGFVVGAMATRGTDSTLVFWVGLFGLSGIAGLAVLCFTRLYGLIFLGAPRSSAVRHGQPAGRSWRFVILVLSVLCLGASLGAPLLLELIKPVLYTLALNLQLPVFLPEEGFLLASSALTHVSAGCGLLLLLAGGVFLYRRRLIAENSSSIGLTWDCGYRLPTARMQYTGGGFAQFPALAMRAFLHARMETPRLDKRGEIFPQSAAAKMEAPDWIMDLWNLALFRLTALTAEKSKALQQGLVNVYILYILLALLAALVWALGWS